ncbi:MAG: serine hydrolase [Alphaproteobacteria bacterium]|nr:serine hydrolase [Alphaproteobacteria bacterium]
MKTYATFAASTAQVIGAASILHALFMPPSTSAMVAPPPAVPEASEPVPTEHVDSPSDPAWTPPVWFPEAGRADLWVLPELDASPMHARGPRVRSRAAIVADLDTGEVLWAQRPDEPLPVASLTKTASALALASTEPDLDRELCVTEDLWPSMSGARSRFVTGACHTGWEYLGAALVASDNRGAMGLAALSGLEYGEFVERMETTGAELGMNARWSDPSGLEDENLASARDMLKAIVAVSAHPDLALAASAGSWKIDRDDGRRWLGTTNRLFDRWDTLAAKTGYTSTARYCFSQVVQTRTGRRLATVVLGAPSAGARFTDSRKLVEWAESL